LRIKREEAKTLSKPREAENERDRSTQNCEANDHTNDWAEDKNRGRTEGRAALAARENDTDCGLNAETRRSRASQGVSDHIWELSEVIGLLDQQSEKQPESKNRKAIIMSKFLTLLGCLVTGAIQALVTHHLHWHWNYGNKYPLLKFTQDVPFFFAFVSAYLLPWINGNFLFDVWATALWAAIVYAFVSLFRVFFGRRKSI